MRTGITTQRDRPALERRRFAAGRLFAAGESQVSVARHFGVSTAATNQWHAAWAAAGSDGLRSKGPPGFASQYTPEKRQALKRIILAGPTAHGYATDFWTVERIRAVAAAKLGVRLKAKRTWLTVCSLGFSCQKPERRARERDEAAIATWKLRAFPRLKKMGR